MGIHLFPLCKNWIFQLEAPSLEAFLNGEKPSPNYHLQGYIRLKAKVRAKQMAIKFNQWFKGIRFAPASSAGCYALKNYCMKDGAVDGPWSDTAVYKGQDLWPEEKMPRWQRDLVATLRSEPERRKIHWFYDPEGGAGKSSFRKWAKMNLKAHCIDYDSAANIRHNTIQAGANRIYIVNMTRAKPRDFGEGDLYSALESIKDGHVISGKYKGGELLMYPPHVVVFANQKPGEGMWSADRVNLVQLSKPQEANRIVIEEDEALIRAVHDDWAMDDRAGDYMELAELMVDENGDV